MQEHAAFLALLVALPALAGCIHPRMLSDTNVLPRAVSDGTPLF